MQFHITYNRPSQRKPWKRLREVSGWYESSKEYVDNILHTYELHGFHTYQVTKHKWLLTNPEQGIRILETR